jgi:hypothetical protein
MIFSRIPREYHYQMSNEVDTSIGFAVFVAKLVLNNGGIIPTNLEKMYQDWKKKKICKFSPSRLSKEMEEQKDKSKGECQYIHMRKAVKGTLCGIITKNGNEYCPKHLAYVKLKERKALCGV